uniref:Uncharacterized protein n=1 Tax=Lepeophtheirus salmonis TaxID=72036 RepID=A0A0K2VHN7_LEPSM
MFWYKLIHHPLFQGTPLKMFHYDKAPSSRDPFCESLRHGLPLFDLYKDFIS